MDALALGGTVVTDTMDARVRAVVEAALEIEMYYPDGVNPLADKAMASLRAALSALDAPQPDTDAVEIARGIAQSFSNGNDSEYLSMERHGVVNLADAIATAITSDRAAHAAHLIAGYQAELLRESDQVAALKVRAEAAEAKLAEAVAAERGTALELAELWQTPGNHRNTEWWAEWEAKIAAIRSSDAAAP